MDEAEEQYQRLCMGAHPWSPSYIAAQQRIDYWLNCKDYKKGIHNNVRLLINLQRKLDIANNPSLSLLDIEREIRKAYQHHKRIKKLQKVSV